MLLALDIGNTRMTGGLFVGGVLAHRFDYPTHPIPTPEHLGVVISQFLTTQKLTPDDVAAIAVSSVVPLMDEPLRQMAYTYFPAADFFELRSGIETGLNILYQPQHVLGADRIAHAMAAVSAYPSCNLIVVDMGTATTCCVINKQADFLGGLIMPGLRTALDSLISRTGKLKDVIVEPQQTYLGQTTQENIQKGVFFAQLGALRDIVSGLKREQFGDGDAMVIGTGGFSHLFKDHNVFDVIVPDLVLKGIHIAYQKNKK